MKFLIVAFTLLNLISSQITFKDLDGKEYSIAIGSTKITCPPEEEGEKSKEGIIRSIFIHTDEYLFSFVDLVNDMFRVYVISSECVFPAVLPRKKLIDIFNHLNKDETKLIFEGNALKEIPVGVYKDKTVEKAKLVAFFKKFNKMKSLAYRFINGISIYDPEGNSIELAMIVGDLMIEQRRLNWSIANLESYNRDKEVIYELRDDLANDRDSVKRFVRRLFSSELEKKEVDEEFLEIVTTNICNNLSQGINKLVSRNFPHVERKLKKFKK
jgi:hypothetical protein